jgi:hypothetical protein
MTDEREWLVGEILLTKTIEFDIDVFFFTRGVS